MVTKKPVVRKQLVPDPGAVSPMSRAVSVALTILETTKLPSWRALSEAVRQGEPKTNADLLTLDVDPDTAALLVDQVAVLDLIRFGPGVAGRKPTTTTVLTCAVCTRWLISTPVSGTPTCVLTVGCTGKLVSAKKATKVGPDVDTAQEPPTDMPALQGAGEMPDEPAGEPNVVPDGVTMPPTRDLPVVVEQVETFTDGPVLFD